MALPPGTRDPRPDRRAEEQERSAEEVVPKKDLAELKGVRVLNPAFDVTPARLVTGLITERGICPATEDGILTLYPERRHRKG